MEMPPAPDARRFTPSHGDPAALSAAVNKRNGLWARVEDGVVVYGLLPVMVSNGEFLPNALSDTDLDDAGHVLAALDVQAASGGHPEGVTQ